MKARGVVALMLPLSALALAPSTPHTKAATQVEADDGARREFLSSAVASLGLAAGFLFQPSPSHAFDVGGKLVFGEEDIMSKKAHGTSANPVQSDLRYEVDVPLADKICNFNRHFAERAGYFRYTNWEDVVLASNQPITFYDSVTGKPLFQAPIGRSKESFVEESRVHGWPSFRDSEVVWENVRVLSNSGETVSVDGTHLGHNLPDRRGNRYCINLVSIAGNPTGSA